MDWIETPVFNEDTTDIPISIVQHRKRNSRYYFTGVALEPATDTATSPCTAKC